MPFMNAMSQESLTGRFPGQYALLESIRHQRYRQALLLVEAGIQIDNKNGSGRTPLICACIYVEDPKLRVKFVQLFLDAGADPNAQDWKGMTALMHSAIMTSVETVKVLLEHPNIDCSIGDQDGNTALFHAAKVGHLEILAFTLNACIRQFGSTTPALEHRNVKEQTVIDVAATNQQQDVIGFLEFAARNPTADLIAKLSSIENTPSEKTNQSDPFSFGKLTKTSEPRQLIPPDTSDLPDISDKSSKSDRKIDRAHDTSVEPINKNETTKLKTKPLRKTNSQIGILPLLSLSAVNVSSNGDPWEWDVGASGHKVKSGSRKTVTGSRSLNESEGATHDDDDKQQPARQQQPRGQQFSNGVDRLNSTFGGLSMAEFRDESSRLFSSTQGSKLQSLMPSRDELHLPPLPKRLAQYRELRLSSKTPKTRDSNDSSCGDK